MQTTDKTTTPGSVELIVMPPKTKVVHDPVVNREDFQWCVICDVDGTLASLTSRGPFDWQQVDTDQPNHAVIELLSVWKRANKKDKIIIVSGRSDICKDKTVAWLKDHKVVHDELHMPRADGDKQSDVDLKRDWYEKNIANRFNVRFVIDDREGVCKMWYEIGLPLFRVGDPTANF